MNERSLAPGFNYSTAVSPIQELQINSLKILFPIKIESESYPNWKFIKTNYRDSSELEITEVDKGNCILQQKSIAAQAVSENNLQNELMYEITCKFNRPLNNCGNIRIGLIEEQNMHSKFVGGNHDENTVFNSLSPYGANTIIKGV